jgi:dihydrodipicolinate synthase/N-acetylneuraminate lyase
MTDAVLRQLRKGTVIPASPLVITKDRKLDERRQRALWRYYFDAGVGGLAIGVHTTQFAIRDPEVGLHRPLLELGVEEMDRADAKSSVPLIRVAGVCGRTDQAVAEATMARELGYHTALLSLAAMKDSDEDALIAHCRAVAEILPLFGFYLQPAVGGCVLSYNFWRRFADIENVAAIKMAPFNRYYTIDVVRAVAESGREDIALYTGNDDNIVMDLVTPFRFQINGKPVERRIVGGLLGHWAVWTRKAVELLEECHAVSNLSQISADLIRKSIEVTDSNAAFFDAANGFAGCIAGLHEILRRQGLLEGIWCLDPEETLGQGQMEEISRVYKAYPHLNDDAFIAEHLEDWLG